jgi:hypothetical protein
MAPSRPGQPRTSLACQRHLYRPRHLSHLSVGWVQSRILSLRTSQICLSATTTILGRPDLAMQTSTSHLSHTSRTTAMSHLASGFLTTGRLHAWITCARPRPSASIMVRHLARSDLQSASGQRSMLCGERTMSLPTCRLADPPEAQYTNVWRRQHLYPRCHC